MELFRLEDMWEASRTNSSLDLLKARLARYKLPWAAECAQDIYHDARKWLGKMRVQRVFEGERHKNKSLYYTVLQKRYRVEPVGQEAGAGDTGRKARAGLLGLSHMNTTLRDPRGRVSFVLEPLVRNPQRAAMPYGTGSYLYTAGQALELKTAINEVADQAHEARWGYLPL